MCSTSTCTDLEYTEDSAVCTITGICVLSKVYASNEYSDNVIVFSSIRDKMESTEARMRQVDSYVREMFLSTSAESLAMFEHSRKLQKYHGMISRKLRTSACVNLLALMQSGIHLYTNVVFDAVLRKKLAATCASVIQRVMCVCECSLDLRVKDSDFRNFVFGMIFLMRVGVTMQNIQILPQFSELIDVLPIENNLQRFMNFRSKCITDTENKFKYIFRKIDVSRLKMLHL